MKNLKFLVFTLVLLGLLFGCNLDPTIGELDGDWNFPDGTTVFFMEGLPITGLDMDISWSSEIINYFCFASGELVGNNWTGTYDYNANLIEDGSNLPGSVDPLTLNINITVKNDRLTMKCTGEGPLKNKTFTGGIKQPL